MTGRWGRGGFCARRRGGRWFGAKSAMFGCSRGGGGGQGPKCCVTAWGLGGVRGKGKDPPVSCELCGRGREGCPPPSPWASGLGLPVGRPRPPGGCGCQPSSFTVGVGVPELPWAPHGVCWGVGGGSTRGSGLNRGRQPREWRVRGGWRPPRGVRGGGQARPGLCGDGGCVWEARRGRSGARAGPEARGTPARGVRAGGEGPTRWPVPLRVAGKRPGRPAARGSLSARESPPLHKMAPAGSVSLPFPPPPPPSSPGARQQPPTAGSARRSRPPLT